MSVAIRAGVFGDEPLKSEHVLVLGMDERSLEATELASRPRAMFSPIYAELAEKLFQYGARGMIFDIILAYDAKNLTIGDAAPLKAYDTPFLKALRAERTSGRIVLGWSSGLQPARRFVTMAGAKGKALVEVPFGASSVVRRVPTVWTGSDGKQYKTLSGRALELLGGYAPQSVTLMPRAPLTTLPSASLIDVLRCEDPGRLEQMLKDKVVFIGGMLPGEDRLKTPDQLIPRVDPPRSEIAPDDAAIACSFPPPDARVRGEPTLPGVFIHAAAADAVMSGWMVEPAPRWVEIALVFGAAVVAGFLALSLRPTLGVVALLWVVAIGFIAAVLALQLHLFVPVSWAITLAPVAFVVGYGLRIRFLDRKATLIRREFGRYLSPVLVQQMIESDQVPDLAGEEREVTVLFADLSGFTAASESLDSTALMQVLNKYLDAMAGVVRDHGGYVDKFIGDAVMAIFNAPAPTPNHAVQAVQAAHEIGLRVAEMAVADREKGLPHFAIKCGVSTGFATVGNVGSRDRVNYTVIGETVNRAARFESLPSVFRTPIVIGPRTAEQIGEEFALLRLVSIQVKGLSDGLSVFAPLNLGSDQGNGEVLFADYAEALTRFEEGDFAAAADLWEDCTAANWAGSGASAAMADEARLLQRQPPEDWRGVLEARSK